MAGERIGARPGRKSRGRVRPRAVLLAIIRNRLFRNHAQGIVAEFRPILELGSNIRLLIVYHKAINNINQI